MKERLPINKDILVWARTSLRLSIEEVAAKLSGSVTAETVSDWEKGIDSPTYIQLEKLANDILKRPIALFFFPEVPTEETPDSEFRTLPGTIVNEIPLEIIKVYRKARQYQDYFAPDKESIQTILVWTAVSQEHPCS